MKSLIRSHFTINILLDPIEQYTAHNSKELPFKVRRVSASFDPTDLALVEVYAKITGSMIKKDGTPGYYDRYSACLAMELPLNIYNEIKRLYRAEMAKYTFDPSKF